MPHGFAFDILGNDLGNEPFKKPRNCSKFPQPISPLRLRRQRPERNTFQIRQSTALRIRRGVDMAVIRDLLGATASNPTALAKNGTIRASISTVSRPPGERRNRSPGAVPNEQEPTVQSTSEDSGKSISLRRSPVLAAKHNEFRPILEVERMRTARGNRGRH